MKKSAYSRARDPSKFADPNPIGTGPYTLAKFSPQGLHVQGQPQLLGRQAVGPEVNVPSYSTNDVALQQLSAGKIDYAGNFVDQIKTELRRQGPGAQQVLVPGRSTS